MLMVVNSVIILRLNTPLSLPFTCLSSRWVLKAWYHLLTDYCLNWDPVKNNNSETPRSLKGISILFFSPRSRRWSQGAGSSLPCPGWVTQPCQQQTHALSEGLLPLRPGGICHHLLRRHPKIFSIEVWQGSKGGMSQSGFYFWHLSESCKKADYPYADV